MSKGKQILRAIVIEDETLDRKLIVKVLEDHYNKYVEVVSSVSNLENAISSINEHNPDLLFLDIELNGDRNGAFKILDSVPGNYKTIFVTAKSSQDDLLKAIRLSCIDFLVKPTKVKDFEAPILKAYDELVLKKSPISDSLEVFKHNIEVRAVQDAKISLQHGFDFLPVTIKNVIRCEAQGNYTKFYFINHQEKLINGNLKSFEEKLSDFGFCRINKSDLINLSHITSFSRKNTTWEIVLPDNKVLFISPQRKQNFKFAYEKFHLH